MPLNAARPYIAYVDEGNFLHPVVRLLREGGWDPHWYEYPQLPIMAVTGALRIYAPLYRATHGRDLAEALPTSVEMYDDLEPFAILRIARAMNAAIGLAVVILAGLLARRLAGPMAGAFAALIAAVIPALVLRGSIASVDSYAVLFVLVCLWLADRLRTTKRPGLISSLAGAAAGLAFASKYPAVLVFAAFLVTAALQRLPPRERLRCIGLGVVGLLVGIALGMPAAVTRPAKVLEAIRHQGSAYRELTSPPLWRQAIVRAEWDLRYEKPELGIVFLALAGCGLVLALRDRRIAATIWGWCAFGGASLVLFGLQRFQPFRNLAPLVPPACTVVALLFARLGERLRRPALVGAVLVAWLVAAFGLPLTAYARERANQTDTRVAAIDWLQSNTRRGDEVLVVRELGFRTSEIARLSVGVTVRPWDEIEAGAERDRPRYIVAGVVTRPGVGPIDAAASPRLSRLYELRFRQGAKPVYGPWIYGENELIVCVLERKPEGAAPSP